MRATLARRGASALAALGLLAGCTAVLDVKDLTPEDPRAVDGVTQTPAPATPGDGGPSAKSPDGGPAPTPITCDGADTSRDPRHCGRCGHDCLGGACEAGVCRAREIASGLDSPFSLTAHGGEVFVATSRGGQIVRMNADGTGARPFATGLKAPWGVSVGGGFVYFTNHYFANDGGGLFRCPLTQGACAAPQKLVAAGHARRATVSGGFVYFAEEDANLIRRVALDGTGLTTVVNTSKPFGIAVDATHVYYTSAASTAGRAPVAGGAAETIGPSNGSSFGLVAVDGTRAYWAFGFADGTGRVVAVDKAKPGEVVDFGKREDHRDPLGVLVKDGWVYWTEHGDGDNGALRACPTAGCPTTGPLELATRLAFAGDIAADDTSIYVVSAGRFGAGVGTVHRVARP